MQQKLFDVVIFSDTINMINVRLCTMVVLTELYPFIQFLVTLIVLLSNMQSCVDDVKLWMTQNKLQLNDGKN